MRKSFHCLVFVFTFLLGALPVTAAEKILSFHADIRINADGSLEATETIAVRAEGAQIRRGLYRDFPQRYRNRRGDQVVVGFEPLEVLRDGKPEPWFTEKRSNGVRVNFGNDSFLPTPLDTTYTFRYRTDRQLGFFDNHDELYWNVTGNDWMFPIEQASARVQLPQPLPAEQMQLYFYTGPQGSRGQAATARVVEPGVVEFTTSTALQLQEGLTVVVGFPRGLVSRPSQTQQVSWLFRDNLTSLIFLLGGAGIVLFYFHHWRHKGVDPNAGPLFPRYEPPEGFSPGALRYMYKGSYSDRCIAADLVQLAVRGCLIIRREKKLLGDKWILEKQARPTTTDFVPAVEELWTDLFYQKAAVALNKENNLLLRNTKKVHMWALKRMLKPTYLVDNTNTVIMGSALSGALVLSGFIALNLPSMSGITLLVLAVALLITNLLFAFLLRRPTGNGRKLLDHIEGLRLYMRVASKDDIARLKPGDEGEPPIDAERFQFLLPYALALDVEDAWTERFIQVVGSTSAVQAMAETAWYHAPGGFSGLSNLGSDLGSSLSSQISSSSQPPGSSSGGGGGGFSGGGGGGGGGGGR